MLDAENPAGRAFRPGARIAVDVGKVRVGIAKCDSAGILATPVCTAARGKNDFSVVKRLVKELDPLEIYVGYPLQMDGTVGTSARMAIQWARRFQRACPQVAIRMIDERLTSTLAHKQLHEAGLKEISHRAIVDQVAAVNILESALEAERSTGIVPGLSIESVIPIYEGARDE